MPSIPEGRRRGCVFACRLSLLACCARRRIRDYLHEYGVDLRVVDDVVLSIARREPDLRGAPCTAVAEGVKEAVLAVAGRLRDDMEVLVLRQTDLHRTNG
jgi:hypothetical protein